MTQLTVNNKTRKKQTEFQKLWDKAEKLKKKNAQFRDRMDGIIQRLETEIRPIQEESARQQVPLLNRLLTLGQRKSLARWQRQVLDEWIREIADLLQAHGQLNADIMDDLARYDAFSVGLELDEEASTSVSDQLREHIERERKEREDAFEAESQARDKAIREEVESMLDDMFGPAPPKPEHLDDETSDLFADELKQEQQRVYEEYQEKRQIAREDLLEDWLRFSSERDEDTGFFDEGFGPFGADDTPEDIAASTELTISNAVFKRLFRSTAALLHPDRELDTSVREKKNALMARLLNARKQGDVITIIEMHREHVGDENGLSKADEKQLTEVLKAQIDELRQAEEAYTHQSPLHLMAFELFYFPTEKRTNVAFKEYAELVQNNASDAQHLARTIKSINTLKPHLEHRYDEQMLDNPFSEFFDFTDRRR